MELTLSAGGGEGLSHTVLGRLNPAPCVYSGASSSKACVLVNGFFSLGWLIPVMVAEKGEAKQESGLGRENLRFTYKNFQDTENTGKQTLQDS